MKNSVLFAAVLALVGCSQNAGNNTETDTPQPAQQPTDVSSPSAMNPTVEADTIPLPVFLSPDLGMLALNGQVQSVASETFPADENFTVDTESDTSTSHVDFDRDGTITYGLMGDYDWKTYERNENKLITKCSIKNSIVDIAYSFVYDEAKRIASFTHYIDDTPENVTTYTYDVSGDVVKELYKSKSSDRSTECTYTILERDHHDNWTRRTERIEVREQTSKEVYYSVTQRSITYYGEESEITDQPENTESEE
ncbi:MAG: hypothetical protein J6Y82_06205 [Bacteroidales bacterium]|nr:hypothetical protein [Bacteroidales bacterium]